jgi:hypothetical protein
MQIAVFQVFTKIIDYLVIAVAMVNGVFSGLIDAMFPKSMSGWKIPVHFMLVMFLFNIILYYVSKQFTIEISFEILETVLVVVAAVSTGHGWWSTYRRSKRAGL